MRWPGKLLRLSWTDRALLLRASLLLAGIRLGLWLLPFAVVQQFLARPGKVRATAPSDGNRSAERIAWAVRAASPYVPGASVRCLVQALAVQHLLRRAGHQPVLHIGVLRGSERALRAHAWVEHEGQAVIGASTDLASYTRLATGGTRQP